MTGQDLEHRPTIGAAVARHTLPRQAATRVVVREAAVPCSYDLDVYGYLQLALTRECWAAEYDGDSDYQQATRAMHLGAATYYRRLAELARAMRDGEL